MDAYILSAFLLLNAWSAVAFKPVIFMHGILAGPDESQDSFNFIKEEHPGTQLYTINAFNYQDSLQPMWKQVDFVGIEMLKIMALFPDGVHLICFSQGGLLCRAVLEKYPHNVDTFISLSAPQSGQFGDSNYLKFLFPNFIKDNLYNLMDEHSIFSKLCAELADILILYSQEGQKVSIGNYWNDPHHQDMYSNYSDFLAVLNNQTSNPDSHEFKNNFLRLKHLVMIGGPDDGVITPWQSRIPVHDHSTNVTRVDWLTTNVTHIDWLNHFGFYNSAEEIVEMEAQKWYINDSFGLQTLDKRTGLTKYVIPGVHHIHWHTNRTVFDCCIEPWLT